MLSFFSSVLCIFTENSDADMQCPALLLPFPPLSFGCRRYTSAPNSLAGGHNYCALAGTKMLSLKSYAEFDEFEAHFSSTYSGNKET